MSDRLYENTVTLRIVSTMPIPSDTHIADLSLSVCTHSAALLSMRVKSRPLAPREVAEIDPTALAMIGEEPDRTAVPDCELCGDRGGDPAEPSQACPGCGKERA